MTRLTLTLAIWLSLVSLGSASLTPRDAPTVGHDIFKGQASKLPTEALGQPAGRTSRSQYQVTDQTEVLLNGQPSRYADIPADARIIHMELGADQKTVLKVHFRTRK